MLPSEGGEAIVQMPTDFESSTPDYQTYHLRLFKDGDPDYRVKLLASTYDSVSEAIISAMVKETDPSKVEELKEMAKNILIRVFFTDVDPEGNLYTKDSQISSTF
jgi:hypothetical protein